MTLRVWHMPQVGVEDCTFYVDVMNISEAIKILNILWNYDNFQFEKRIKPDFSNTSGLEYYDSTSKTWQEYEDEFGNDICNIVDKEED